MIKLVVFDLDNVIIDGEAIDEIGKLANVEDEIAEITEKAMQGEIDFETSIKDRVKLLEGTSIEDIQKVADELPLMNGAEDTIARLKEEGLDVAIISGSFDVVACNPPYKPIGTGVVSSGQSHSIIRHESSCTVDDVVRVASGLLRFGGRFCLCLRPERLTDVFVAFRKYSLEPKRLQMVQQRVNKAPKLFLVEGRRGGKPGGLVTLPTLFIENSNGEYSDEMMKIYGSFKECL